MLQLKLIWAGIDKVRSLRTYLSARARATLSGAIQAKALACMAALGL